MFAKKHSASRLGELEAFLFWEQLWHKVNIYCKFSSPARDLVGAAFPCSATERLNPTNRPTKHRLDEFESEMLTVMLATW